MRIAFYAPLKSPEHGTPSGDRRVGRLFMQVLRRAGHEVELASEFRSLDATGDPQTQARLRSAGTEFARQLADRWQREPVALRPDLWFTYHVYYKAPDWLGPAVTAALDIPYVMAEASFAPKRASGPWALGHAAVQAAIQRADLVLGSTRHDLECLSALVAPDRLSYLPPFLDPAPLREALSRRADHRAQLARMHNLAADCPWLVVVAMMRAGDKLSSYRELAQALARLGDLDWQLLIAGDGPARDDVVAALQPVAAERVRFLGELGADEVARVCAASDLFVWPAVNEAYGMAMLEAQAAGVPVVSCALRGVPDVVCDGRTGLLAPPGDPGALAARIRLLLLDEARRVQMGREAASWVWRERGLDAAATILGSALAQLMLRRRTA
jgi:glycosyltransferase involved in cell wall biosynthesis